MNQNLVMIYRKPKPFRMEPGELTFLQPAYRAQVGLEVFQFEGVVRSLGDRQKFVADDGSFFYYKDSENDDPMEEGYDDDNGHDGEQ